MSNSITTSTDYHNSHAHQYDDGYLSPYWKIYQEITWNYIQPLLPANKSNSLILDAGGGTGFWSIRLAKLGYRVILSDISTGMLEVAKEKIIKEKLQKKIEVVVADITNMSIFKNSTFDLSLAEGDPVSYCKHPTQAISELARVTKRGGHATVSVDNKLNFVARFLKRGQIQDAATLLKKGIGVMKGEQHAFPAHMFTIEELEDIFKKRKLKPIKRIGKPVWVTFDDDLNNKKIFESLLSMELKFGSLPSVAGIGGHIALVGKKI